LHKPDHWDPYEMLIQSIIDFWLTGPPLRMLRRLPATSAVAATE